MGLGAEHVCPRWVSLISWAAKAAVAVEKKTELQTELEKKTSKLLCRGNCGYFSLALLHLNGR